MNDILDLVWNKSYTYIQILVYYTDRVLSPLEIIGPWFVIFLLSLIVVLISRVFGRFYVTKRLTMLKKEYEHWKSVRDEALNHPDKEKGKQLARNIDQAELNKAYYDYFFELMLKHFATNLIPILLMVSYVTTVYTPETMYYRFKKYYVFTISFGDFYTLNVSSLFWFVISVCLSYILIGIIEKVKQKYE